MPDSNDNQVIIALAELASRIETLIDKHEELAENVSKIKEIVYNPDEGLYARLKGMDIRLLLLESWKENNAKLMWIIVTVGTGLLISTAWKALL